MELTGELLVAKKQINIDDDFGLDVRPTRRRRNQYKSTRTEFLGKLHELLTKGLPDLCDEHSVLDVKTVADYLGISFQAVYKFFEKDQIPSKRVSTLIALSKSQKKGGPGFKPLVRDDFWEFISR